MSHIVYCSRCDAEVDVTDQMTPTIPARLPNMPEAIILSNAGHVCNPQHVLGNALSALAALATKGEEDRCRRADPRRAG